MSYNDELKLVIIFDTNILYEKSERSCNFCKFTFNKLFYNIQERIEELDLTEHVYLGIPEIVWKELYSQRLAHYSEKKTELTKLISGFRFPCLEFKENELDYEIYLNEEVNTYKKKLSNYQTRVIEIDLPSSSRFQSIIKRALDKKPPFEGDKRKSDKGFKDTLIWESLLDYRHKYPEHKIALYTRDGLFNEYLAEEYHELFCEDIYLIKTEEGVMELLMRIQMDIAYPDDLRDDYSEYYTYVRNIVNNSFIRDILYEIELKQNVGTKYYDLSSIENTVIIDIINVTDDENLSGLTFELNIEADLYFSNIENREDIIFQDEPVKFFVEFNFEDESFYLTKVLVLDEDYDFDMLEIEGVLNA